MIPLRYHLLSLTVAALALVLGLILGASALSGRLVGVLTADRNELITRVDVAHGERVAAEQREGAVEQFVARESATTVSGALDGRSVALMTLPDADPTDVLAVTDLVEQAGATLTGRLDLTDVLLAPENAESVRGLVPRLLPAGAQLPTTTDTGELTGALLGSLVTERPGALGSPARQNPDEVVAALAALSDAGLVAPIAGGPAPEPAQMVLVVAGDGDDQARGRTAATLVGALESRSGGAVLAGRGGAAVLAATNADPRLRTGATTVDGLDRPSARLATVLALRDRAAELGPPPAPAVPPAPAGQAPLAAPVPGEPGAPVPAEPAEPGTTAPGGPDGPAGVDGPGGAEGTAGADGSAGADGPAEPGAPGPKADPVTPAGSHHTTVGEGEATAVAGGGGG